MAESDRAAMAAAQARADEVYVVWSAQAPHFLIGESLQAYRIRLARGMQSHSAAWKGADLAFLARADANAFANVERAIYADAAEAARRPPPMPMPTLRQINRRDSAGRTIIEFYGSPRAWMQAFMAPTQCAVRIGGTPD